VKKELKKELAKVIRSLNKKGWSPATSTNYSFRDNHNLETIVVSRSGVDKACFSKSDFIEVNMEGIPLPNFKDQSPSAETLIHCSLYTFFPETKVILHSHSIYPILWSMKLDSQISFQGYEVQKGFSGQGSHTDKVEVPILENSQDMVQFSERMQSRKNEFLSHCFIIKGHGTYAWGKNLFEAKRHLETIEYLCELEWKLHNSK
jgi:methylthioribulose-1-phosphate dehydratase